MHLLQWTLMIGATVLTSDLGALVAGLDSESRTKRVEALVAIGVLGPVAAPAVPAVLCMLFTEIDTRRWDRVNGYYVSDAAITALAGAGPGAVPDLIRVLEAEPFSYVGTRWHAGTCGQRQRVLQEEGDWDDWILYTSFVAEALAKIGKPAVQPLTQALRRARGKGEFLARAIARVGPPAAEAVPELLVGLKEAAQPLREPFVQALGAIGPAARAAVPAIRQLEADPTLSKVAREALARIGSQ